MFSLSCLKPIFGLMCMHAKLLQSCPTLCDPMDCSLSGSSVRGILQARMPEWVTIPFSRGSFWPKDQTQVSCIAGRFLTVWATREDFCLFTDCLSLSLLNFKLSVGRNYFHLSHFFSYLQCLAQCMAGSRLYKNIRLFVESSKRRGYMYTYSCFNLLYSRTQHCKTIILQWKKRWINHVCCLGCWLMLR